jgi:hypothetical protein
MQGSILLVETDNDFYYFCQCNKGASNCQVSTLELHQPLTPHVIELYQGSSLLNQPLLPLLR